MLTRERDFFNDPEVYQLEDLQYTNIYNDPDRKKTQTLFSNNNKNPNIPIVIDYGSNATKAGWGNSEYPSLVFRSVISKNKDLKNVDGSIIVGNKLKDFEYNKNNYKTPFERNVIQHFGLLENLNDYTFAELGVNDSRVNHPVLVTECFASPDYCRSRLFEQLFECYQTPSVVLGVDALFSHYYNTIAQKDLGNTCIIISLGHMTTHIVPVINGEVQMNDIKRINVGGYNSFDLLYKHLNLKYPQFKQKLGQNSVQAIQENLTFVATDYKEQLNYFQHGKEFFHNQGYANRIAFENNKITLENLKSEVSEPVILEFPTNPEQVVSLEEVRRKQEMRREQAERLRETMAKRREEKKEQHFEELKDLEAADAEIEADESKAEEILKRLDYETHDELKKRIIKMKLKLGVVSKQSLEEEKVSYINVPDEQLTAKEQRQKRYQVMQKQAAITRKLKKEVETKKKEEVDRLKAENPEIFIADLYEKRKKVISLIEERKKLRTEFSGRSSRGGNQKRLQTYIQLGESQKDKKGNVVDTFGLNDEDWAIYKKVSKEPVYDDDEEGYYTKLNEIDKELQKLDPNFEEMTKDIQEEAPQLFSLENPNSIELNVDQIRGPEVFFQPSLAGVEQMGIIDAIELILRNASYPQEIKTLLLKNIFLTGGSSFTKNFTQRLKKDLESITPAGTEISIKIAKDPIFDTWRGMQTFGKRKDNIVKYGVTKAEYEENGSLYYKPNQFSNIYK